MKKTLFTSLLLLLVGNSCFALEAKFSKERACIPAGENFSSCEIIPGDTLSKDAIAVYGDWHLYPAIKDANPQIANANKIYFGNRIIIPDVPSQIKEATIATTSIVHSGMNVDKSIEETHFVINMLENNPSAFPLFETKSAPVKIVMMAAEAHVTASSTPAPAPTSAKAAKTKPVKVNSYVFIAAGIDLHGPLETKLILFNSEEEKRLGLPAERIDLKPSLAVPAKDGNTTVFVHLKKIPAQPFILLVGGINTPVDSAQIQPYTGKIPGDHGFVRTLATFGRSGAQGAVSFFVGGPILAACVVGIPQGIKLFAALHEKRQGRKLELAQAAVDKSKLALYRANNESAALSGTLPKETLQ